MNLQDAKFLHIIGIGGIGVSAVAKLLFHEGKEVSGSDLIGGEIAEECRALGILVMTGHRAENIPPSCDLVIYSDAVPEENPERRAAAERGISEMSYAEALGELSRRKRTIAVSGTNGKSTTTAMLGLMLEAAGFDPTVIVGSKVKTFPYGNLRVGKGDWLVVEGDEHRAHMLHLHPEMIVLTNVEEDHLDYYRDLAHIKDTFGEYISKLSLEGALVWNADDAACEDLAERSGAARTVSYGLEASADYMARRITVAAGKQEFDIMQGGAHEELLGSVSLQIPGQFNVANALAAASAALALGVPFETVQKALAEFPGIWRRFERLGERHGAVIVSDYAHHPTSVRGTIVAAREFYPERSIVAVFQPHQHNRTKKLFKDFVQAFAGADVVIISDIYEVPGREEIEDRDVSSHDLVAAIQKTRRKSEEVVYGGGLEETKSLARALLAPDTLVLIMGAGDIYTIARELLK